MDLADVVMDSAVESSLSFLWFSSFYVYLVSVVTVSVAADADADAIQDVASVKELN